MRVKSESNLVGCLMFVIFLMGSIGKYAYDAYFANIFSWDFVEIILILPLSLVTIFFLSWVLFDSSWLNFDDDEKEMDWKSNRWLKFSVLFLLPLCKIFTKITWDTSDLNIWGENIAQQIQLFFLILLAYLSLCSHYGSGLGRLFQPYTIPRSRIYTDSKGQKFELNFVGTTLSIVLIVLPFWVTIVKPLGRLLVFVTGNAQSSGLEDAAADAGRFLSSTPEARAIADGIVLILIIYSFTVIFVSCVRVTFFLNSSYNFFKFAPIPLTPVAIIFSDNLCGYMVTPMLVKEWITMLCFFMVCFVAYASLASPPDSLSAILFQPHIPMIEIVKDLPDITVDPNSERRRTAVVFPEGEKVLEKN